LPNVEFELTEPGNDGLVFASIGVRASVFGSLVRLDTDVLGSLKLHGFVKQDLHRVGHPLETIVGQQLDSVVEIGRLNLVGYDRVSFSLCQNFEQKPIWPALSSGR